MVRIVNVLNEVRILCRPRGSADLHNVSVNEFAKLSPQDIGPVEQPSAWKGKGAYEGAWWFSRSRRHVQFSSLRQRDMLLLLDCWGKTRDVQYNPVAVLPPRH